MRRFYAKVGKYSTEFYDKQYSETRASIPGVRWGGGGEEDRNLTCKSHFPVPSITSLKYLFDYVNKAKYCKLPHQ